ncbi:protease inhibitor-like [Hemicordylus capensis]|uniref:protease inhibitor-like n=1 Tax=Hemicordylus capensis TaxID=884348 RepID=UPI002302ADAA|nr:protease inhibitor-like isoform X2 [Hemicordylus capensis]XP_053099833.1 protease inhibitor-like [Hemicordylus capensis]
MGNEDSRLSGSKKGREIGPENISHKFCRLPAKIGPCRGSFHFYYYDSTTKTCEMFHYGGCGGNDNRFLTKQECLRVCGETEMSTVQ